MLDFNYKILRHFPYFVPQPNYCGNMFVSYFVCLFGFCMLDFVIYFCLLCIIYLFIYKLNTEEQYTS